MALKTFNGTAVATIFSTDTGIPFTMRIVRKGDTYGRGFCLTNDKDMPLIEFYDARYVFSTERGAEFGQFVSRYNMDTLTRDFAPNGARGLNLEGSEPNWTIDAAGMRLAMATIANWESVA